MFISFWTPYKGLLGTNFQKREDQFIKLYSVSYEVMLSAERIKFIDKWIFKSIES